MVRIVGVVEFGIWVGWSDGGGWTSFNSPYARQTLKNSIFTLPLLLKKVFDCYLVITCALNSFSSSSGGALCLWLSLTHSLTDSITHSKIFYLLPYIGIIK